MAGGPGRLDQGDDRVAVAVVAELAQAHHVPRGFAFVPELLPRAAVEVELAGLERQPQGLLVRVGERQDLAAGEVLATQEPGPAHRSQLVEHRGEA